MYVGHFVLFCANHSVSWARMKVLAPHLVFSATTPAGGWGVTRGALSQQGEGGKFSLRWLDGVRLHFCSAEVGWNRVVTMWKFSKLPLPGSWVSKSRHFLGFFFYFVYFVVVFKNLFPWCFQVASFSSTQARIYEAKKNSGNELPCHSSDPRGRSKLLSSPYLPESSHPHFIYNVQGF